MSDPALLEAFRRQCITVKKAGRSPLGLLLMWRGEAGVDNDDLVDIAKEVDANE